MKNATDSSNEPVPDTTLKGGRLLAGVFRFLALSMHYPEKYWFNEEYLGNLRTLLEELDYSEDIRIVDEFLKKHVGDLEPLQVEYTRLFITGVPHVIAPPYGSVYMEGEGSIMGESTEQVRGLYREWGFELTADNVIADHLICELEFLALLAESDETATATHFCREFFWPWFGVFQERVAEGAELPFYKLVVRLIDFFTREEDEIPENG